MRDEHMSEQTEQLQNHRTALTEKVPYFSPDMLVRRIRRLEEKCWTLQNRVIELEERTNERRT